MQFSPLQSEFCGCGVCSARVGLFPAFPAVCELAFLFYSGIMSIDMGEMSQPSIEVLLLPRVGVSHSEV